MLIWPKSQQRWFEWLSLALKPAVILVGPGLLYYDHMLRQQGFLLWWQADAYMQEMSYPVGLAYGLTFLFLTGTGIIKYQRHERKRAAWEFRFAGLALINCLVLCGAVSWLNHYLGVRH